MPLSHDLSDVYALLGKVAGRISMVRYNGALVFGSSPYDVPACRSGGRMAMTVGYPFLKWLRQKIGDREILPTDVDPRTGEGLLTASPTVDDIVFGWTVLNLQYMIRCRHWEIAAVFLDMGFSPTFVGPSGG